MRVPFLDLVAQYKEVQSLVDPAVATIFANAAFVLGPHNKALEEQVAARHKVKHGIAVNSGTDALRIAMQACGIGPGDEVITTAFTFVASIETIVQVGARPVFVDVRDDTFDLDPNLIAQAVTARTKAILPIHLYGQLADMPEICRIADSYGLNVIEDAAQAIDDHRDGRFAGQWSRAAGISFYVTKNLGAAGDGGLILTDDDEVAERSRSLRVHGMGRERYYYDDIGYTSRMSEIQAAFLVAKLTRLSDWNLTRQSIAARYDALLADSGVVTPAVRPGNNHTYHQYTVLSDRRDELAAHLKANEVDSAIYYPVPLHLHKPYFEFGHGEGSLPVTESVSKRCLSLPIHPHLSSEQVEHVGRSVREFSATAAR
jgi:dTDP-4-amino-4,6-dideoxygalactose transaminase